MYAYCRNNPVIYYDPSGYSHTKGDGSVAESGTKSNYSVESAKKNYTESVKDKIHVEGNYTQSTSNSKILKAEAVDAGVELPPFSHAMHHIVPAVEDRAIPARAIMDEVGIQYNSATNSVALPNKKDDKNPYITTEAPHIGNHSPEAIQQVNRTLVTAKKNRLQETGQDSLSKDNIGDVNAITTAIYSLRRDLLDGKLKLN